LFNIVLNNFLLFQVHVSNTNYFSEDSYRLDEREWESVKQAKNLNIAPTIKIRNGYRFNIFVIKDMILEPLKQNR
jgi:hypothetical protein